MTPPTPAAARGAPYRPLGLLRCILALLVMVQHAQALLPRAIADAIRPLEVGNMAVFCFFIVSGFVIAEAASAFYADRPAAFLGNRILRTYPTYVAALVLSSAVLALVSASYVPDVNETPITPARFAPGTVAWNLLALFPIWRTVQAHVHVPEILEQGWALRIEYGFYLVLAASLLLAAVLRLALSGMLTTIGVIALTMLALSPALGTTMLENAPYFVFGVAYYYVVTSDREQWFPASFCIASLAFMVAHLLGRDAAFGVASFPRDRTGELILLMTLTAPFLVLAGRGASMRWPWLIAADRFLGELTYPVYLMHWCVLVAARTWLPNESWTTTGIAFMVTFALASLTLVVIERPVAKIRTRLRHRAAPGVAEPMLRPRTASF